MHRIYSNKRLFKFWTFVVGERGGGHIREERLFEGGRFLKF